MSQVPLSGLWPRGLALRLALMFALVSVLLLGALGLYLYQSLARVRTLLRRGPPREAEQFQVANLQLDVLRRRVLRGAERITLTNKEFALLQLLMERSGEVLSRTQIASQVWQMNFDSDTNVVDVAIRRLRAKVDDPFTPKLIHTVRGMGYTLEALQ